MGVYYDGHLCPLCGATYESAAEAASCRLAHELLHGTPRAPKGGRR